MNDSQPAGSDEKYLRGLPGQIVFPFALILPMQADSVMSGHVARAFEVGRLPAHSCHEWYCQMPDHPAPGAGSGRSCWVSVPPRCAAVPLLVHMAPLSAPPGMDVQHHRRVALRTQHSQRCVNVCMVLAQVAPVVGELVRQPGATVLA